MQWENIDHIFTWNELSSFHWGELSLSKYELLIKSENAETVLPANIKEKTFSFAPEISNGNTRLQFPEIKTVNDFLSLLNNVAKLYEFAVNHDLISKFIDICQSIESFLKSGL